MSVKWRTRDQEYEITPAHQRPAQAEVLKGARAVELFKRAGFLPIPALRQLLQWTSSRRRVLHLKDSQVRAEVEQELAVGELLLITNQKRQRPSQGAVLPQKKSPPPAKPVERKEEEEELGLSFRVWPEDTPAFKAEAQLEPPPALEAEDEVEPPPTLQPELELEPPATLETDAEEEPIPGITI